MQNVRAARMTVVVAAAFTSATAFGGGKKDIVDTAIAAGDFKTLVAAVQAADLVGTLKGEGPFTVFAPTDEAFAKLPEGMLGDLLKPENKQKLTAILTYHVVPGRLPAAKVVKQNGAATVQGQCLDFSVDGRTVRVDGAKVIKTDIKCTNGVIHVIDAVVLPASDNIVQTAMKAETFNTLLTAAAKAGLAQTLANGGPFTVFAPTDEAFAKLPAGTVDDLLKPENNEALATILKAHVVPGRVYAADAAKARKADTLAAFPLTFSKVGKELQVNGINIIAQDVDASNGVIHVIDRVILPE
jgi:transforming growth factor-beta-induced protein